MNAEEARRITDEANSAAGKVLGPMLEHAHQRIREAAGRGKNEVNGPLYGYGGKAVGVYTAQQEEQICELLKAEGYKTRFEAGDYQDVRETGYWTVSW